MALSPQRHGLGGGLSPHSGTVSPLFKDQGESLVPRGSQSTEGPCPRGDVPCTCSWEGRGQAQWAFPREPVCRDIPGAGSGRAGGERSRCGRRASLPASGPWGSCLPKARQRGPQWIRGWTGLTSWWGAVPREWPHSSPGQTPPVPASSDELKVSPVAESVGAHCVWDPARVSP